MLSRKMGQARKEKGWTVYRAAKLTQTVHPFAMRKLESGETDPSKVSAATMVDVLKLYWPRVDIVDFLGEELAKDTRFKRIMKRGRKPKEATKCPKKKSRSKSRKAKPSNSSSSRKRRPSKSGTGAASPAT